MLCQNDIYEDPVGNASSIPYQEKEQNLLK